VIFDVAGAGAGRTGSQLRGPSEAMPPKRFEPQNDDRGGGDGRAEDYAKQGKGKFLACRQAGQLRLDEVEFLHHLRVIFPNGIGLAKGEAVGIKVAHVACVADGVQQPVAHACLMLGYRA
jgi:hypothetical protein